MPMISSPPVQAGTQVQLSDVHRLHSAAATRANLDGSCSAQSEQILYSRHRRRQRMIGAAGGHHDEIDILGLQLCFGKARCAAFTDMLLFVSSKLP